MQELAISKVISSTEFFLEMVIDPLNNRIRMDDYRGNLVQVLDEFETKGKEVQAKKWIVKARYEHFDFFLEKGYQCEGKIDGYFLGSDAFFFCKYLENDRRQSEFWMKEDEILSNVTKLQMTENLKTKLVGFELFTATLEECDKLAELYRQVFEIYPTPLNDPNYIEKTINEGTIYVGFKHENKIISAASAEKNTIYKNAELTDCATLPTYRKHGLLKILLSKLEEELKKDGIYCAYSLSRALSFGMNAALHQLGYLYRGRLMNNCYIFDKLENMNIWVKDLSKPVPIIRHEK